MQYDAQIALRSLQQFQSVSRLLSNCCVEMFQDYLVLIAQLEHQQHLVSLFYAVHLN